MEQRKKPFQTKTVVYSLLISLLFHLLLAIMRIHYTLTPDKSVAEKKQERIKLIIKKTRPKHKKRQIVATEKSKKDLPDERPSFLGESNQSFEKEVVAKQVDSFQEAGRGVKQGSQKVSVGGRRGNKKKKTSGKKKISFKDLAMGEIQLGDTDGNSSPALGVQSGAKNKVGLSQNNDYVEDIPLGDITNLNTVEYKYYGFFRRIKQKLEQHWGTSLRQKARSLYRNGKRIPASSVKITSLVISLDKQGNIVNIIIKGTSGVREFDDAAIESFNKAGPFPNPPKGMLKNGSAQIEWGFVVRG